MKTNPKKTPSVFTFGTPLGQIGAAVSGPQNKISSFNDFACVPNASVATDKDKVQNPAMPFYF